MGCPFPDRLQRRIIVRCAVTQGHNNIMGLTLRDKLLNLLRISQCFRSQHDDFDYIGIIFYLHKIRRHNAVFMLGPFIFTADEGSFQVRAQYFRARQPVLLHFFRFIIKRLRFPCTRTILWIISGSIHVFLHFFAKSLRRRCSPVFFITTPGNRGHVFADTFQRLIDCLHITSHGCGQERRHPGLYQEPAHDRQRIFRCVHCIRTAAAVDMQVDKTWRNIIAACICYVQRFPFPALSVCPRSVQRFTGDNSNNIFIKQKSTAV